MPIDPSLWMKKIHGKLKKHVFAGIDIETEGTAAYNEKGEFDYTSYEFVSLAIYHQDGTTYFTRNKREARELLTSPRFRGVTFVATNLTYDYCGVFWDSEEWNQMKRVPKGSGGYLGVSYNLGCKRGSIHFIDTINYVPFSVKKLGEILHTEKKTPPKWLGERKPRTQAEWTVFKEYNVRDAEISMRFMIFLEESMNTLGANLQLTIASTAKDLFQREYMDQYWVKESERLRGAEWVEDFIRQGYYGGRTETFARGHIENMNYYDINSLYPAVMRNELPLPQSVYHCKEPSNHTISLYEGVSDVTVYAPDMIYPLLPYRTDNKLLFPVGEFRGTYNHVELREAIKLGYKILDVHKQIIYTEVHRPFKKYVETLYKKRVEYKKEGSPMQLTVKLLLNSLYGKFAQNTLIKEELYMIEYMTDKENKHIHTLDTEKSSLGIYDDYIVVRTPKKPTNNFIFPILSSYITSYARLLLYEYITKYDGLYCDTDSVITKSSIPETTALGGMKKELVIDDGVLIKSKLYRVNNMVKAKGLKKADRKIFDMILAEAPIIQEQFIKPRTAVRRGVLPNSVIKITKHINLNDDKRVWKNNFNPEILERSMPICLQKD